MTDARLSITFAGPLVSLQDAGRPGGLRFGVSPSGPMDRLAYQAGAAALGVPATGPAIEVSLGGLSLTCQDAPVTLAITGGAFEVDHNGQRSTGAQVLTLLPDERLILRGGAHGSWAYVTPAGQVEAATWMGSAARHSMSGLGSAALATGGTLIIKTPQVLGDRLGALPAPPALNGPIRVVMGPQDHHFAPGAVQTFLTQTYRVSPAYDRMGMRLQGPALPPAGALSIPSEPVLRGSVQVSGDGVPTVLMADHQPTGGYPKIATVLSCDTDRLAQLRAGDPLRFAAITPSEALHIARSAAVERQTYLDGLNAPRGTLEQRLMSENLIHVAAPDDSSSSGGATSF